MAEEEQEAAKAAAKKAKKQRQKLKAKKQAQPEPAAASAEPHGACIPSEDAQPLSPESSQLTMESSELLSSTGQHQAQGPQTHDLDQQQQQQQQCQQQQQQQQVEAVGTSLSVSSALGAAAAQDNNDAKAVAVELSGLHLPTCDQAANKGHTDADFLQQLFCCPLTKVSHVIAIPDRQASVTLLPCSSSAMLGWLGVMSQHQK